MKTITRTAQTVTKEDLRTAKRIVLSFIILLTIAGLIYEFRAFIF